MIVNRVIARFQWRCRKCGKVETSDFPVDRVEDLVSNVQFGKQSSNGISLTKIHYCEDSSGGIADLIGYDIVDTMAEAEKDLKERGLL